MSEPAPPAGGALWIWAVRIYERPEIRAALLWLQDCRDVDVPTLLWRIYLHQKGLGVRPEIEDESLALSGRWRADVVENLRRARDALQPLCAAVDADGAGQLREETLSVELMAEKLQLDALERLALKGLARPRHADLLDVLASCPELSHVSRADFSPLIAALAAR